MSRQYTVLTLNIESHKHLDRIMALCQRLQPDIVQFQEVFKVDVADIAAALEMQSFYVPMAMVEEVSIHQAHALGEWGVAQFTKLPVRQHRADHYVGVPTHLPKFFLNNDPNSMNRVVSGLELDLEGKSGWFATTHFTWSTKGQYTPEQQNAYRALQQVLDTYPNLILTGDFNSPRVLLEGETTNVFNQLAERYRDCVPKEITTSIDGQYHKAGQLELMVDGFFASDYFEVDNVQIYDGVSDHKALCGQVRLRELPQ